MNYILISIVFLHDVIFGYIFLQADPGVLKEGGLYAFLSLFAVTIGILYADNKRIQKQWRDEMKELVNTSNKAINENSITNKELTRAIDSVLKFLQK